MTKKDNTPSAASKRGDQLWIANDELTDDQRETLNAMIEKADKYPTKEEYFEGIVAESFADTKLPERLTRTAARAKLSDLAYAKKYLAVKKGK